MSLGWEILKVRLFRVICCPKRQLDDHHGGGGGPLAGSRDKTKQRREPNSNTNAPERERETERELLLLKTRAYKYTPPHVFPFLVPGIVRHPTAVIAVHRSQAPSLLLLSAVEHISKHEFRFIIICDPDHETRLELNEK